MWSAIPNFFLTLTWRTGFQCFSKITYSGWHVLSLYILPQLHGIEFTQFLVMLYFVGCLTRRRYFWRVVPLLNVILMDYISFESYQLDLRQRADRLWWVFEFRSRSFNLDFLELMLCSLGSCCNGGSLLTSSFFLAIYCCHY